MTVLSDAYGDAVATVPYQVGDVTVHIHFPSEFLEPQPTNDAYRLRTYLDTFFATDEGRILLETWVHERQGLADVPLDIFFTPQDAMAASPLDAVGYYQEGVYAITPDILETNTQDYIEVTFPTDAEIARTSSSTAAEYNFHKVLFEELSHAATHENSSMHEELLLKTISRSFALNIIDETDPGFWELDVSIEADIPSFLNKMYDSYDNGSDPRTQPEGLTLLEKFEQMGINSHAILAESNAMQECLGMIWEDDDTGLIPPFETWPASNQYIDSLFSSLIEWKYAGSPEPGPTLPDPTLYQSTDLAIRFECEVAPNATLPAPATNGSAPIIIGQQLGGP